MVVKLKIEKVVKQVTNIGCKRKRGVWRSDNGMAGKCQEVAELIRKHGG